MSEQADIGRANQARRELELVDEAFAAVRQAALEGIVKGDPEQQRRIDRLIMTVQIIDGVRKVIEQVIDNGTIARARHTLAEAGFFKPN